MLILLIVIARNPVTVLRPGRSQESLRRRSQSSGSRHPQSRREKSILPRHRGIDRQGLFTDSFPLLAAIRQRHSAYVKLFKLVSKASRKA